MKFYHVWGRFKVTVDFDIEANSQEEAEKIAKQRIIDDYDLDSFGGIHQPNKTAFDELYVDEQDFDD